jgi:hypothetical protein
MSANTGNKSRALNFIESTSRLDCLGGPVNPSFARTRNPRNRWLLGTHQGAIGQDHLDDYLDEFTFRFNRRTSKSRGKLFYRLAQQSIQTDPIPFATLVKPQPIVFGGVK